MQKIFIQNKRLRLDRSAPPLKGDGCIAKNANNVTQLVFRRVAAIGLFVFLTSLLMPQTAMAQGPGTVGGALLNIGNASMAAFPIVITAFAYLAGLVLAFLAIVKTKEHVDNPQQTPISEPVKRFIAGGALFAFPTIINAVYRTIVGGNFISFEWGGFDFTFDLGGELQPIGGEAPDLTGASEEGGLDTMMVNLIGDIFGPMHYVVITFAFIAGLIFVVIGITRLLKSAQEGPRGPGGFGTIMTFLVAGALFAVGPMLGAFASSFFNVPTVYNNALIDGTELSGVLDPDAQAHVQAVINSIMAFMMVVGLISFVRGFFLLREFADTGGQSQQASLMASLTHIIGGALLVNLGNVIMGVQNSLGLGEFGYLFF